MPIFHARKRKVRALVTDGSELHARHDVRAGRLGRIVKVQEIDPTLPIVVMTAWATIELAVEAMKRVPAIS